MDTIDITNLNRQFLFRQKDVGSSKAETAAKFVNKRVPGVKVTAHNMRLEEKPQEFYKQFNMVICGLDSIEARRNINNLLYGFVKYNEEGEVDLSTVIPYIDGGTEGFKGQARVIFPGVTACFECTMALFTDDQNFPICTIKSKPRLPEHCVQYALLLQWNEVEEKNEIEKGAAFDKDNPKHIKWIYERACERANQFNIRGVTYRLTQGVVKRIIPAIASTNAIIASACTNEAIKVATLMAPYLNDHMFYNGNGDAGIYTYMYTNFREPECRTCGQKRLNLKLSKSTTLAEFRQIFRDREDFKLVEPSVKNADGDYLYTDIPAFEEGLRPNLDQPLFSLIGGDGVVKVTDKSVMKAEIHTTVTFE